MLHVMSYVQKINKNWYLRVKKTIIGLDTKREMNGRILRQRGSDRPRMTFIKHACRNVSR